MMFLPLKLNYPHLRAARLRGAGYFRLEELTQVTQAEILKLHGMGPKGVRILREALAAKGLVFADQQRHK